MREIKFVTRNFAGMQGLKLVPIAVFFAAFFLAVGVGSHRGLVRLLDGER